MTGGTAYLLLDLGLSLVNLLLGDSHGRGIWAPVGAILPHPVPEHAALPHLLPCMKPHA